MGPLGTQNHGLPLHYGASFLGLVDTLMGPRQVDTQEGTCQYWTILHLHVPERKQAQFSSL